MQFLLLFNHLRKPRTIFQKRKKPAVQEGERLWDYDADSRKTSVVRSLFFSLGVLGFFLLELRVEGFLRVQSLGLRFSLRVLAGFQRSSRDGKREDDVRSSREDDDKNILLAFGSRRWVFSMFHQAVFLGFICLSYI